MGKLGFVFPGQGSQFVGLLSALSRCYPVVKSTFDQGSEVLGYDVWHMAQNGPVDALDKTEVTQPVMLLAGVSVWRVWQMKQGPLPVFMAGHSLGEYTALVCSGVLCLEQAVDIVQKRGQYMQEAVPQGQGGMVVLLGFSESQLQEICEQASLVGEVAIANYNAPGQVVLGGFMPAIDHVMALAKAINPKRVIPVAMSTPSHCALMKPAADRLRKHLLQVEFKTPQVPIINNLAAKIETEVTAIREALVEQLYRPLRWTDIVRRMSNEGVDTLIECGPGKVLTGLNKRICRKLQCKAMSDPSSIDLALKWCKTEFL